MPMLRRLVSTSRATVWFLWAIAICAIGLLAASFIDPLIAHVIPLRIFLPVHTVLEFTSIVVSFAVFATGWYGYRQTQNRRDVFIATAFAAVGAIDLVHTLSYQGMPDFLGVNMTGKAAAYWLAARFTGAVALLVAAFVRSSSKSPWTRPVVLMPTMGLVAFGLVGIITAYGPAASALMFVPGVGLTLLKKGLEYGVVLLNVAAFIAFSTARGWRADSIRLLRTALIISMASEVCFTLYASPYDAHNLLGHIYKTAAYYLVLQALFVSALARPYQELSYTKEQLQRSFTRIGEALASGLQKDPTLKLIASLARQMFDADIGAIGEIRDGGMIEIGTFDGVNAQPIRIPVQGSFAGLTFIAGSPLVVGDIRGHPNARPEILALGVRAFMSAPIFRDGRPAGAVYVWSFEPGRFSQADAEILTAFARHAAVAVGNAEHYEREHRIAEVLQQAIFPPGGLVYGEFEIAGKYEPAWDEARVGGDFYDYFDLGGGKLGLVIGDVSGKGLDAAAHTAIIKYTLQAYLREGVGPAEAVRRLDGTFREHVAAHDLPDNVFITLLCGVLDSLTGRLAYANAGHEPPLRRSAAGDVVFLDSTGPVLGLGGDIPFDESEIILESGDTLVLYTDGITEAHSGTRFFGTERLATTVRSCQDASPQDTAERIYKQARDYSRGSIRDDVALMVIRRSDSRLQ